MNTALARKLRKRMPPAEARMWNLLRDEPFVTWHFRRQVPIGRYFADFASHSARLVVEIDGDTHGATITYDAERDRFIRDEGYRVLRILNRDVMGNVEGVATYLAQAVAAAPTQPLRGHPPHEGEGEGRPH